MEKHSTRRVGLTVLLICALALAIQPTALAQETTGGIKGYVKDSSGARIPGAQLELTSAALLVPKKAESDNAGYFYFSVLPPGSYTLTVTAPKFHTYKQTDIALTVGALPTIDVSLEVGTVSEIVEVTGRTPIVDVTRATAPNVTTIVANRPFMARSSADEAKLDGANVCTIAALH